MVDREIKDIDSFLKDEETKKRGKHKEKKQIKSYFDINNFNSSNTDIKEEIEETKEEETSIPVLTGDTSDLLNDNEIEEIENDIDESLQDEKTANKKSNKKRNKLIAIITAGALAIVGLVYAFTKLFRKNNFNEEAQTTITTIETTTPEETTIPEVTTEALDKLKTNSLKELGIQLEHPKVDTPKKEYSNPTGNVNINKIVEDNNDTLWVDEEAAAKKDEIGKEVIDDQDGKLDITPDGDVYVPEVGYEIRDEQGNVIAEGDLNNNDIPSGYEYDNDTGVIRDSEHANSGLYIAPDGSYWENEAKYNEYKEALNEFEQFQAATQSNPIETETITTTAPIITIDNNGNYTNPEFGLTFKNKEDYDQWILQGYEGYGIVDGVMVPNTPEMDDLSKEYVKTR